MYRPFCKQWLYFDRQFNEMVYQIPKIFPTSEHPNLVIHAMAGDARRPFSALITDVIPDSHLHDIGQAFPLYYYDESGGEGLFADHDSVGGYVQHDAITDSTLTGYQERYGSEVTKEDLFYYTYGLLHSPEYRERYAADLKKMIPRLPMARDFWAFSKAGRDLALWHLDYESVEPWPLDGLPTKGKGAIPEELQVERMRFAGTGRSEDRRTIVFNSHLTLREIPEEAYDYQLNGRSAIEWVMDRYEVKVHKESGIRNDPNLWSDDPRYVVDLVARIVRVSVETMRIVKSLPPID
jgi:predicted helicase